MKTTIYLIRHGEIDNPKKIMYGGNIDLSLNSKGEEQIKNIAHKIKDMGVTIKKVYSSPMLRARQSAQIIAAVFNVKKKNFIIDERLKDSFIPALAGQPISIRAGIHNRGIDEYAEEFVKKGNESRKNILKRMKSVFDMATEDNIGDSFSIVSHGDPLDLLLFSLSHPNRIDIPPIPKLDRSEKLGKAEVCKVVIDENGDIIAKEFIR